MDRCVVAFGAMALQYRTFAELQHLKYLSISVNALAAAGDVLIASILCTLLHRSRTGFHRYVLSFFAVLLAYQQLYQIGHDDQQTGQLFFPEELSPRNNCRIDSFRCQHWLPDKVDIKTSVVFIYRYADRLKVCVLSLLWSL
ncbi:hypothetical protein C0991_004829 [Blastosporella zonata]|nr:hypothetical protein C0991_004829 [Blastosporella zonata]